MEGIFYALVQLSYSLQSGYGDIPTIMLTFLLLTVIYAASFIILIRRSRQIAIHFSGKSVDDNFSLKIGKRSLLHIVLIGTCVAAIIPNIAKILIYLFETFKEEVSGNDLPVSDWTKVTKFAFKVAAIQTIAAIVILYFSKDISSWFIRKNKGEELTFESEPEKDK